MYMIDVLKRLAELDAKNPNVAKPVLKAEESLAVVSESPEVVTEGVQLPKLPEPDLAALKALAGTKKLNESAIAECGMMGGAMPPAAPSLPASINMSAGNANEIVAMFKGIMDLAKSDGIPTQAAYPAMGAQMPSLTPPMGGMDEPAEKLPAPAPVDDTGGDELADMMKKLKTGEPVKIKTDMPVKVSTDDKIKATTDKEVKSSDDSMNVKDEGNAFSGALAQAKAKGDDEFKVGGKKFDVEGYANEPNEQTKGYNPNDFANIINKVRTADMEPTPYGSASNPMPEETSEKKMGESLEEKLMAEYKKFLEESPNKSDVPAYKRKEKGGDWKVSTKDLEDERTKSPTSSAGLARRKKELGMK